MTRIVSGVHGGRRLMVPKDARVRPTAERVREAWLNILGPALDGARVLDLFAGSGALGLEALSRGASHVTFVELGRASLTAIGKNIEALGVEDATEVCRGDAMGFAGALTAGAFDLALADPPFSADFAERLVAHWRAVPFAGILAVEHPSSVTITDGETRRWGDIAVTFLRAP